MTGRYDLDSFPRPRGSRRGSKPETNPYREVSIRVRFRFSSSPPRGSRVDSIEPDVALAMSRCSMNPADGPTLKRAPPHSVDMTGRYDLDLPSLPRRPLWAKVLPRRLPKAVLCRPAPDQGRQDAS